MKRLNEKIKNLKYWDVELVKWSTMAAILFILTIWPGLWNLVESVNPWYYFAAFVILAIRPIYKFFG